MTEKKCFKCGEVKNLSEFYKHAMMADGRLNKCKECNKADVRENRKKRIEYYRSYDCERGNRQTKEYRESYYKRYPMKYAAHNIVSRAVSDGRLIRASVCEACNTKVDQIHAHHDDYAMALQVRWLCVPCHKEWHMKNGEGKNGC